MFGATRDSEAGAGGTGASGKSVISSDLQVDGEIESKGAVEVLGEVRGNIHATDVAVAESGRVTGSVHAKTAVLRGQVSGEIEADSLNIHASARIEADIAYQSIGVEYGARVKGALRQRDSAGPAATAAPSSGAGAASASPQASGSQASGGQTPGGQAPGGQTPGAQSSGAQSAARQTSS